MPRDQELGTVPEVHEEEISLVQPARGKAGSEPVNAAGELRVSV